MFPLSDSFKSKKISLITLLIVAINIYVFFLEIKSSDINIFINRFALTPNKINFLSYQTLTPFFTSLFLHSGFVHIISNMWFLWIFGDNVEGYFGHLLYLIVYLCSGLTGGLIQYFLYPASNLPMLGASGAISGILGAYYVLYPNSKIKTLLPVFFFITIIDIPAVIYLFYWFFVQLFSGFASLGFSSQVGGVAFWAHIGGFLTGYILAKAVKKEKEKNYIEGEIIE